MLRRALFLLAMVLPAGAGATDFWVDPVLGSPAGDGSAGSPWQTIQQVIEDGRIETRHWESLPYVPGLGFVTVHPGAPVKAGDTIWLRTGDHGEIFVRGAYNELPITIAAAPGARPRLTRIVLSAAQNWIVRGLAVSPSHALPPLPPETMIDVENHSWHGPSWDIVVEGCELYSVADASGWSAGDWVNAASSGIAVDGDRVVLRGNDLRNVRFGISVSGADALVAFNRIDGFSADGLRGLGDGGVFEYNLVQNSYVGDPPDGNHDDGFQSWSFGPGGVGTGEVRDVVLRGNLFINSTPVGGPPPELRTALQGIGCFDGMFVHWTVENNVVITDHWHGISLYGAVDSRIVNNTVIDAVPGQPGPPWIMTNSNRGTPSQNVVVRNNLAADYSLAGTAIVADHNLEFSDAAALFVAPPFDVRLLPGSAAEDAGSDVLAPAVDAAGTPRPQGAGWDLGAFERCPGCIFRDDFERGDLARWD
ncbi:MAG: choice-of-anchor Q domain-containing protein [Thermoanaerobaculia bacterium]